MIWEDDNKDTIFSFVKVGLFQVFVIVLLFVASALSFINLWVQHNICINYLNNTFLLSESQKFEYRVINMEIWKETPRKNRYKKRVKEMVKGKGLKDKKKA